MELKDKESFVVEPEVNHGKTLIGCCLGIKLHLLIHVPVSETETCHTASGVLSVI